MGERGKDSLHSVSANGFLDVHDFYKTKRNTTSAFLPLFPQGGTAVVSRFPGENTEVSGS